MPARQLKEYLDKENVHYVTIRHSPAYTAPEIAASAHIPGRAMAKTVIVKIEGKLAMLVLPSNRKVVLQEVRELLGVDRAQLASEEEFRERFPECETGAMPPFGNLYGLDVYVAPAWAESEEVAFNAGTHTEVLTMAYRDFVRLTHPQVLPFTT